MCDTFLSFLFSVLNSFFSFFSPLGEQIEMQLIAQIEIPEVEAPELPAPQPGQYISVEFFMPKTML